MGFSKSLTENVKGKYMKTTDKRIKAKRQMKPKNGRLKNTDQLLDLGG